MFRPLTVLYAFACYLQKKPFNIYICLVGGNITHLYAYVHVQCACMAHVLINLYIHALSIMFYSEKLFKTCHSQRIRNGIVRGLRSIFCGGLYF